MANFGELVLVLGDAHIPDRASKIAPQFQRMLVPNKMQHVVITGNVGNQYESFSSLAPNVYAVAGDCDGGNFPDTEVFNIGSFRIGVIHGHQLIPWKNSEPMERIKRKLQVDVLITGHTHQSQVNDNKDFYHINPGSITGAYTSLTEKVTPSFILLAVQDRKITCYVYELINGEVEVSKTEITKKEAPSTPAANPALLDSLLK